VPGDLLGGFLAVRCPQQGRRFQKMRKSLIALGALTAALAVAAGAAAVTITVNGTIAASDPTQTGRLESNGGASTCAAPKASPGLVTAIGARHYDSYTYTNSSGSSECVTVTLTQTSGTAPGLFTAAYLGSFNPADPGTNYLADPGGSGTTVTYSFLVAASQTAVVVVHEVNPDGCLNCNYTIVLNTASTPTAATFASAGLTPTRHGLLLRWRTASEVDLLSFQVYRSRGHAWRRVSRSPIAAKGSATGAAYRFLDRTARPHTGFRYRIRALNRDGTASWFGPVLTA
jgi:hypothetical protein